jgi:aminopeptidase N
MGVEEAHAGERAVDVLDHRIDLTVGLSPPSLSGHGEVRVRLRRAAATVVLDAAGLLVSDVAGASGPLRFRLGAGKLCVALDRPAQAGSEVSLRIAWVVPVANRPVHFSADEIWAGYSASAWMPTVEDPAQRATLSLRITADAALTVVATGRSLGRAPVTDDLVTDLVTQSFVVDRPSPPFLYAFSVGRFERAETVVDGVILRAFGPPGSALKRALDLTAPMYRALRDRLGADLPAAEYSQVFVRGDAAQEAAGMSLISASALDDVRMDPKDDWIFSHELAHQWFAWLVPCADFSDFWLNEGFATFLVAVLKEQRWGAAAYASEVDVWRRRSAEVHAGGSDAPLSLSRPGAPARRPPTEAELPPRGVTYFRGALVLDKLRRDLGDGAFWDGVRRYVRACAGRGARSDDLRAAFEAASGRSLQRFFDTWVYAPAPVL